MNSFSTPSSTPSSSTPTRAETARRGFVGLILAGSTTTAASAPTVTPRAPEAPPLQQRRVQDVPLFDHNGHAMRFYSDILQGRRVLLNVMYATCSNVCPPATRNLLMARGLLGEQARGLRFVSVSLTPLSDPPDALRAYRQRHDIEGDWMFLTGAPDNIEAALRSLGYLNGGASNDLRSHVAMARLCDERSQRWTHINTLLSPRAIARMVHFDLA